MSDTHFTYAVEDGIAIVTWDRPDMAMNVLTVPAFDAFEAQIDKMMGDDDVKGMIVTTGKKDFAGGMDLNVLSKLTQESGDNPAQAVFDFTMQGHRILRKLERNTMDPKTSKGGKPVVAAIRGTCAGIGTELALACHHRIMADGRGKIGLPEILVGLFPGGGGTTRYSRMVGAMAASPVLLEGKMLAPAKAKSAGLIDEVCDGDDLIAKAKDWINNAKDDDIIKPWDKKGWKMPGGTPYHPAGFMTFVGASAMVHGKTQGVYPAAKALLSSVYEGALVPFDTALKIEARWFTDIILNPTSSAMIRSLFINKQALEKGAVRPKGIEDQSVKKVGILGAGMMGAGIAYVSAFAGIEVVLIDRDQDAADKGLTSITELLDKAIKRKRFDEAKKNEVLGRVTATPDYAHLKGCDLIVEAVFEDPKIKADVTKLTEEHIPDDCIFATNTSTLPISELAKAFSRPDDFIGIHFFSPVHQMMLVEIIKGAKTGDRAVAKSLDFVRQIRKTPIVVNDARFFYANRCIIPYVNEGMRMISEGVEPALIENAAKQLGMPLGPLQLTDETSIDLGVKIAKATKEALGKDYDDAQDDVLFKLFDEGRLGRKSNAGFYSYDDAGKRQGLWEGLRENWSPADVQPDTITVQHRLIMVQALEAIRALEENVLMDIREGDVGAILGWGFMPWSGGPISWLDMIGAGKAVEICDALAKGGQSRFEAPALLRDIAAKGDSFYGRFGPADAKAA